MSERGAGSRLSQLSTVYHRVDGGYQIKGAKAFCSGAGHASGYLVAARHADDQSVVSQFLVPADTPGLRVEQSWDSLGMRATCSHDLHLDVTVGPQTTVTMIADETVGITEEEILPFLQEKGHPALSMDPLIG